MRDPQATAVALPGSLGWRQAVSAYYELTKPGITLMVSLTTAAGFYLALPKNAHVYWTLPYAILFLKTIIGTILVSGGSCAFNHALESGYDGEMKRTMYRPIPAGKIRREYAVLFGSLLTVLGLSLLFMANPLTAVLALSTTVLYLAVYTPMKRRSSFSTLIGGVPGALPTLGGWLTVTGRFDMEALVLFFILYLWQMPHFLSLAYMYRKDYERGGFRMLTEGDESGFKVAKHVVAFTLLLVLFSLMLSVLGVTGSLYFWAALAVGGIFLGVGVRFFVTRSNGHARVVLLTSYLYLLTIYSLMFIDKA